MAWALVCIPSLTRQPTATLICPPTARCFPINRQRAQLTQSLRTARLLTKAAHPSLSLLLLHSLFPHYPHFLSLSLPPPSLHTWIAQYSWEEEEEQQEEEVWGKEMALWQGSTLCRCLVCAFKPSYYVTSCSPIVYLISLPQIWGEYKEFYCFEHVCLHRGSKQSRNEWNLTSK